MTIETQSQLDGMKKIGAIVANCLAFMKSKAVPGITTIELDTIGRGYLERSGAISAPKITYNFPGYTCISIEQDCAHGIPSERVLQESDLINIDVSASLNGFFADNGESFVVGNTPGMKQNLCKTVETALSRAIKYAVAGNKLSLMGKEVEKVAAQNGFNVIRNLGGHGVGHSLHESPKFIPGFYDKSDLRVLTQNSVIAFEPFISSSEYFVKERADGWTLFVSKGYTVQKEHTLMVGKNSNIVFTRPTEYFA